VFDRGLNGGGGRISTPTSIERDEDLISSLPEERDKPVSVEGGKKKYFVRQGV